MILFKSDSEAFIQNKVILTIEYLTFIRDMIKL